ncbi:hypothetical protein [Micromonospora sp. LH3U1]|uniref:hypothetical protein n=1 Tax=Micromonospora sp. LH3U1 TaxID=3018339 RepID=UPI00234B8B78|nr:hypothetical protein [Micromonospora sp. LH3U1]WCN83975.1 hypothetical protein PCA76_13450 [Micromonospora sp. LH3U1]
MFTRPATQTVLMAGSLAEGSHRVGRGAGPELENALADSYGSRPVRAVFDGPVPTGGAPQGALFGAAVPAVGVLVAAVCECGVGA